VSAVNVNQETIGRYLLRRLYEEGAQHIFGIPGDYILGLYGEILQSPIQHIGTTREDTAAFAADGYARCRGMGALAVTYGVGALNTVNAVAGAHAESSPVVVISGAPGVWEQREDPLLHHRFGPFSFQREIFDRITCATVVLDDPVTAFRQIDRALASAKYYRKPVYIELPRDQTNEIGFPAPPVDLRESLTDPSALAEAVAETIQLLTQANSPVIIAGVELHRHGLQNSLLELIENSGLPVATTLTGKSVIGERHPAYLGVYEGAMSTPALQQRVESSDCLLMLGVTLNDVDTGIYTANLNPLVMIRAAQGEVNIRHHRYLRVTLAEFLAALARQAPQASHHPTKPVDSPHAADFPRVDTPMTVARLIGRLNDALTPEMMIISDVGDCLFSAIELRVHERTEFLASAFYTTMGFAVPAALGAQIARPDKRAIILVGDGAFQMTGTELSTQARLGLAPIVVVFNNVGYSTERNLLDGPFNDIASWNFHRLGEVFGPMRGYDIHNERDFESAWKDALTNRQGPSILNVHLAQDDASPAMRRLTEHMRRRIGVKTD